MAAPGSHPLAGAAAMTTDAGSPRAEPMRAWTFDTQALPPHERGAGWSDTLARLRLPVVRLEPQERLSGRISTLRSPLGLDFAVLSGSPLEIAGRSSSQRAAVWLVALLAGDASFSDQQVTTQLKPGDVVYGPSGMDATLRLESDFELLLVNVPRIALDHRLLAPRALTIGRFSAAAGPGHVFSGLLRATARALADLTSEQLAPIELAIPEFLLTLLAHEGSPASQGGVGGARARHRQRLHQLIESRLGDPDLTLRAVARDDGTSTRTLQKLFESMGESFTGYVRDRRLDRCRQDLASPAAAALSISDICLRWGFNSSSYFSRAFKDRFGVPPREYRNRHARDETGAGAAGAN